MVTIGGGFGVMPKFHFEQDVAPAGRILGVSAVQHEPFAADLENFIELPVKRLAIADLELLDGLQRGTPAATDRGLLP